MGKVQEIRDSEKGQHIVEKGKKGFFHIIFGRTGIILLMILLQIGVLFVAFGRLQEYLVYTYWSFSLLSVIAAIVIINRPGNPGFKLAWMVPIMILPVFGVLFYVFIETQLGTRMMNKKLMDSSKKMQKYSVQNPQIYEELKIEDRQMANLSHYISTKGGFPTYKNTNVSYFPLGENKFEQLIIELEKAEKFIFMEYFIVAEGRMWGTIHEILKRKVKEGVEVRFMYDGTCTIALLPHNYRKKLEAEGIYCKIFNPIKPALSTTQNNRDHRKIVVIDGHTAFTGGVNLADEYINEKERFGHWKDTAVMIKGDAVRSFTWMFLQIWDINIKNEEYEHYLDVQLPKLEKPAEGYVIPYSDSPLDQESVGELVYMDILNTAREYVHIMSPYLILDNELITALTYAAKRGVDVKIIMPFIPDKGYAFALGKTYYPELIQAGVKIYQYLPGFIHAKSFTSDGEKAVVGTINLDYRSLYLHFECAVYMYKVNEIAEVEKDFQETLEQCKEITMEEYKKEKLRTRIYGKILRLIAPLM
ncbi:MAG: cardiolipin synthase [Clostridia bacterium]|nr:cardiolipin synthase [Clostridia bacterium]NCC42926.1 cardiolipin synthase [Clostridia bacterium]